SEVPLPRARGPEADALQQALRRCERRCLLHAGAVLAPTRARADEVSRLRGGPAGVHLVPDGVEVSGALSRVPGPLRIRHVGWDLSSAGLRLLLEPSRPLRPR